MLKKQNFYLFSFSVFRAKKYKRDYGRMGEIKTSGLSGYYVYDLAEFMKPATRSLILKFWRAKLWLCGDDYVR